MDMTTPDAAGTRTTTCPACGGLVSLEAFGCVHCGQPLRGSAPLVAGPGATQSNVLAIVSLVCAVLFLGGLGSVLAVILGHVSLSQIKRSGGSESGRGFAIAGLVIGYLGILAMVVVIVAVLPMFGSGNPVVIEPR